MAPNRLASELSPYLIQHAGNPVDWFPWGDEAFALARSKDKPVFLSIGYSSCHWCHVMARECFEDHEVASRMNAAFINIKVDREELPHIDAVYMQACQLLTGSGGWPLSVIMTPDRLPFFAATFLPKHTRQGTMGMMELIDAVERLWREKKDRVASEAAEISRLVRRVSEVRPGGDLDPRLLDKAFEELHARFDPVFGGFGTAPKFPMPQTIMLLLRYSCRTGSREALDMAVKTLDAMRSGGIHDHVGAGFHRYATDRQWLVPHFEKMLYDQALLALAYTEAFQVTGRDDFGQTARDTLDYVLRDLRTDEGLFAGAEDADSEGGEGRFYLWTERELRSVLDEASLDLAREAFGLKEEGNVPGEHGLTIIHLTQEASSLAGRLGMTTEELTHRMRQVLADLRAARAQRQRPFRDTKALTDWNGLMVAALARAGAVLRRTDYLSAAMHAADFILENMAVKGRLRHVFMNGQPSVDGGLDDYAFLTWGLIELYEATFETRYLETAASFTSTLVTHFSDPSAGGFFTTADDTEVPMGRTRTAYDNALPSGNSVAMLNLVRLAGLQGDHGLREQAMELGRAFSVSIGQAPSAHAFMLCGLDALTGPAMEVVIAGDPAREDTRAMIEAVRSRFLPQASILLAPEAAGGGSNPLLQGKTPVNGRAAAYVCRGSTCLEPVTDPEKLLESLR